jgi:beta-galactosidase
VSINAAWRFSKGDPNGNSVNLNYASVKAWLLPTGNPFVTDDAKSAALPDGNLGDGVAYVTSEFDDASWRSLDLPHDYAIEGPFTDTISSSMGRLPATGVAWYRKRLSFEREDLEKSVFLDIDGAMSYSMVWLNGEFVGGWPYGYASYRVELTSHLHVGDDNVLAIRLDNPVPKDANWDSGSSRWYPGAGIYRNVWLTKTALVHVGQWGTHVTTPTVTPASAQVDIEVTVDNDGDDDTTVSVETSVFELDATGTRGANIVAELTATEATVSAGTSQKLTLTGALANPRLWQALPGEPNLYRAVTRVLQGDAVLDVYETDFGVRTLTFDGEGLLLNGNRVRINGVCNHHDLGALGTALNSRALQRQLQILADMGVNAIRTAHNPPAPELLTFADRMGFLVMDEAFDVWADGKAEFDHHVFFPEWHEQDLRALMRRDRNHPSVFMWSLGNEIVEQNDAVAGPAMARELTDIAHEEDPTRPTVSGMNSAKPDNPFSGPFDAIGLNYQGTRVRTQAPQYPTYHTAFPDKFVVGTETVSTFSSRGIYLFPVPGALGEATTGSGAGVANGQISSYDLFHADWSYVPDEEFQAQDRYPYVAGEFVWTGFDYLGEPTPLDSVARSSYFGIVDLAGFPKDRYYLYQSRWRPDLPMAHILPHWTWPSRTGQVTPVHVYTSGDEAELFLNGNSLGRKTKADDEHRLRWDDVVYEPGELGVVSYKAGEEWAWAKVETAGAAAQLLLTADRDTLAADGVDLSFVTVTVTDAEGRMSPTATNSIQFEVTGPADLVATDNGDPTDRTVFSSTSRKAFSGLALAIVRTKREPGAITVTATASGLTQGSVQLTAR